MHFVAALAHHARTAHARFAGRERLEIAYDPNVPFETASRDAVAAALDGAVSGVRRRGARAQDCGRRTASRRRASRRSTDISLAAYGSQGQQRTAVLALKLAEYAVMSERANDAPLLLLDDVLSELDEDRAAAFLAEVGDYEQTFVTATHLPVGLPVGAHLSQVRGRDRPRPRRMLRLSALRSRNGALADGASNEPVALLEAGWEEIVGADVARNSRPARIAGGTLTVTTRSSAWSHQLTFLAEDVLRAVQRGCPRLGSSSSAFASAGSAIRRRPRRAAGRAEDLGAGRSGRFGDGG